MVIRAVLAVALGYVLGSFPSANIASRLVKGKPISEVGAGNMGTLNTLRQVGLLPGILVLLADIAKGALAVLAAGWLDAGQIVIFIAGFAAILGHNWPIFLRFKGGRGGATTFGVLLGLAPLPGAISFGVMLIVAILTSNLRLALTGGFVAIPLLMWAFGGELSVIIYAIVLPLLLGIRMALADWRKLADPEERHNLFIDHDYTFWQRRRKPKP